MKLKRIITIFISAVTMLTCMPLDALAAQTQETESGQNGLLESDLSVNGTNSFGNLLADELNTEYSEQQGNNSCNVFSAEVTDKTVAVEFETTTGGTLLAAIYDEAGEQMLASGSIEVTAEETEKEIAIEIDSMPQYFYLKVFLVDTLTLRPLCTAYESPNYTQEMQEFLAKTVDDFAPERVLNLDEDKTNNFAVYGENTVTAESSEDVNKIVSADENTETYVIESPDSTVAGLQNGDVLACEQENHEVLIVKVESIEISGDTATITGQDTSMEDVFEYVKIDSSQQAEEADYDPSTLSEGITYEGFGELEQKPMPKPRSFGVIEDEGVVPIGISLGVKMAKAGGFTLTGGLKYSADFSMKLYLSLKRQFIEFKVDSTLAINLTLTGTISEKIKLGTFDMMIFPGVNVGVVPKFITEASVSFSTTGTLTSTVGFGYEHAKNKNNFYNLTTKPKYKDTMSLEGKIEFGLELEPNVSIISSKLVRLGFTGSATVQLSLTRDLYDSEAAIEKDKYHECKVCFAGDIKVGYGVSIDLTFLDSDKIKLSKDLAGKDFKITDLYYSVDHNDYNYGTCPWQQFRVTLVVLGEDMQPLSSAYVKIDDDEETYMTDTGGVVRFYLPGNSTHTVTVEDPNSGMTREKNITVKRSPRCVYLWMLENNNHQGGGGSLGNVVKEEPFDPEIPSSKGLVFKEYKNSSNKSCAKVVDYTGSSYHVIIPDTYNGKPVTRIGDDAFNGCSSIKTVVFPDSLKVIDWRAFANCTSLEEITLTDNITDIDSFAFTKCTNLKTVNIPAGFSYARLSSDTFSPGSCTSLTSFNVDPQNQYYCSENGILFNKDKTELIYCPIKAFSELTDYTVPSSVKTICYDAFGMNQNLSSITIPEGVTTIGSWSFAKCENLKSVTIPGTVTDMKNNTFSNSKKLEKVSIHDGVTYIPMEAFCGCEALSSLTLPNTLKKIGTNAFNSCNGLKSVTLPDGLKTIENFAFCNCKSLSSVSVPNSLYDIGTWAFHETPFFNDKPDGAIYVGKNLYAYRGDMPENTNFVIKDGSLGIAAGAFSVERHLVSVTIPASIKDIGYDSFYHCTGIKDVYYYGTAKEYTSIPGYIHVTFDSDEVVTFHFCYDGTWKSGEREDFDDWGAVDGDTVDGGEQPALEAETYTSKISLNANEAAEDVTEETNPDLTQTEFKNLLPNEIYNFYVLKAESAENLLGSDNLLYMDQYTSDAEGNITAAYIQKEEFDGAIVFLVRMSPIQLTAENTNITAEDLTCTGESQVVTPVVLYDGMKLIPGTDYDVEGDFSAVSEGEYKAVIVGKGNYSGKVEFTYKITCNHEWQDGVCTICGKECQHEFIGGVCSICGKECQHEFVDGVCTICGEIKEVDFLLGDANNDGKISAVDASIIFSEYKKIYRDGVGTFTDEDIIRCDSNDDGKITAVDASYAFSEYKRIYRENNV